MVFILFVVMVALMIFRAFAKNNTARTLLFIAVAALAAMICWILLLPLGI